LLKTKGSKKIERLLGENQRNFLSLILKIKLRGQKSKEEKGLKSEGNEN
jgi:hypothetical protein